ncbi:hypothetical protein CEXT_405791 [Caerostris extrusa]|uniref:Uncharacterized protein n=1 Tax=Caerostris extrusa TaxID=172846 RepID=A0AAV4UNP3_CAEEX|nr:hypothetical protein CEXT_405791 [Caerostris extrusa]
MACFGEILLSDPEPMEWEDVQVEEPMDWLQAEEPMEWEETPLEVSQPSTTKVSLPVCKSKQPQGASGGDIRVLQGQPTRTAGGQRSSSQGKATSFFLTLLGRKRSLMTTRGELSSDSGAISPLFRPNYLQN